MTKRRMTCLCLAVLLLLPMLFTGCGKETNQVLASYTENSLARVGDAIIAQNNNYVLAWLDSAQRFVLQDKTKGTRFLSAPLAGTADDLSAPVIVEYYEEGTAVLTTSAISGAASCLDYDTYSTEKIEGGVRAVYSFDEEKIAVTVEYLLRDDGLEIRIPMDGLQEDKDYRIYEIKVAPFFAAVQNDTGSYLMVPSGSGALIKAERSAGGEKTYYEAVYGEDVSEPITFQKRVQGQIHLPVFGAMNVPADGTASTGMLGIIEEGAECAMVYAQTGGLEKEYSTVYSSFRIRSKEKVVYNDQGHTKKSGIRYSNEVIDTEYLSVRYIPLNSDKGEDVTYNGMAARYRKYLQERGYLQNTTQDAPSLSINMLGSTQITKSLFGIPYQSDTAVTTLEETQQIVSELKALLGDKSMLVTLEGYGQGGLANTVVGGGFKLSSTVGNKKDFAALVSYAAENGIILSLDYELAKFQDNGSGIRVGRDSAMCVSTLKAQIFTFNINTGLQDEKGLAWYLVARDKLVSLMDKTIASIAKNKVSAISIGSLNRIVYSDFRNPGYASAGGFAADVKAMLDQANQYVSVVADEANDYVAVNSEYITEVPMHSTRFNMFSEDIPFYAMVFQGYIPLTSASINLSADPTDAYLQAVATGMGLQFTLCDTLHDATLWDQDTAFVSSRYEDWKDRITEMVNESADLYAKVGTQSITRYEQLGALSFTTFANGVKVVVNYSEEAVTYNDMVIEANSFIVL